VDKAGPSKSVVIVWTSIMLATVALAVVGGMSYQPLRVRYAIHHVQTSGYWRVKDKWLRVCIEAARCGDQRAMVALEEKVGGAGALEEGGRGSAVSQCHRAAEWLANVGPGAKEAFRRLLREARPAQKKDILAILRTTKSTWALPLLVEVAQDTTNSFGVLLPCADTIRELSGGSYRPPALYSGTEKDYAPQCRRSILSWWDKEGKAKYGSSE
jgi:hypothetical protein